MFLLLALIQISAFEGLCALSCPLEQAQTWAEASVYME